MRKLITRVGGKGNSNRHKNGQWGWKMEELSAAGESHFDGISSRVLGATWSVVMIG